VPPDGWAGGARSGAWSGFPVSVQPTAESFLLPATGLDAAKLSDLPHGMVRCCKVTVVVQ